MITGRNLFPVSLDWEEVHPGVVAWLHWKVGLPSLWPCLSVMPPEDALIFLHVMRSDTSTESEVLVSEAEAEERQRRYFERLGLRH